MRGEGEASGLLINLILFGGVIMGLAAFSGSLFTNYGVSDYQDFSEIETITKTNNFIDKLNDAMQQMTSTSNIAAFNIAFGIWDGLKLFLIDEDSPINIMTTLISDLIKYLGLPSWVLGIGAGIVTIIILFGVVIPAVTKVKP